MNEQTINQFQQAVGACAFDELRARLDDDATLRWITPAGTGQEAGVNDIIDRYKDWFDWYRHIDILATDSEAVGNRFLFSYRFRVQKPERDWHVVRQLGVLDANDTSITAIDLVCTGLLAD